MVNSWGALRPATDSDLLSRVSIRPFWEVFLVQVYSHAAELPKTVWFPPSPFGSAVQKIRSVTWGASSQERMLRNLSNHLYKNCVAKLDSFRFEKRTITSGEKDSNDYMRILHLKILTFKVQTRHTEFFPAPFIRIDARQNNCRLVLDLCVAGEDWHISKKSIPISLPRF